MRVGKKSTRIEMPQDRKLCAEIMHHLSLGKSVLYRHNDGTVKRIQPVAWYPNLGIVDLTEKEPTK